MKGFKGKLAKTALAFTLVAGVSSPFMSAKAAANFDLTILHTNDSHITTAKWPRISSAVKDQRNLDPNALLLDAGDATTSEIKDNIYDRFKGLADLWFMNYLRYDAMAVGNHELNRTAADLSNFVKNMYFPMVSANVSKFAGISELSTLYKDTIATNPAGGNIYPAIIKTVNGQKIGIIGLLTTEKTFKVPGVKTEDAVAKTQATIETLKAQHGVNKIIVLSHLGYNTFTVNDRYLAERVTGIDVIVGGDSHTTLTSPVKIGNTLIVQAGSNLNYLGVLKVTFDDNGDIASHTGRLVPSINYESNRDPVAQAKLEKLTAQSDNTVDFSDIPRPGVTDVIPPAVPTVNVITDQVTQLTGRAEAGSTVIATIGTTEIRAVAAADGSFVIPLNAAQKVGTIIKVVAQDLAGNVSIAATVTVTTKLQTIIGQSLYDTAVEVSKRGWTTANTVIIANGENYALTDGLTATPLASAKNAPLLLTPKEALTSAVAGEIKRLGAKNIILIGGHLVIAPAIENSLKSQGFNVTRLGGLSASDTSLLVAQELDKTVDATTAFIVNGAGAPDALSIASVAGKMKQPILLTDLGSVPKPSLNWLKAESITDGYFIGGRYRISQTVIDQVSQAAGKNLTTNRVWGESLLDTNAEVIKKFYPATDLETIIVAKADILADALGAGPLAAKWDVPVLIASRDGLASSQVSVLQPKKSRTVTQVGGNQNTSVINHVVQLMN